MKKIISIVLCLVMILSVFAVVPFSVGAREIEKVSVSDYSSGDYEYRIYGDNTVMITKYIGSDTELIIPSILDGYTVISIGSHAFDNCLSLMFVTLPNSVTNISIAAFNSCTNLEIISIPDSVISIEDSVFCNCDSLVSINVDVNNPKYFSLDGVLFNKDLTEIICYPAGKLESSYTILDSVEKIGYAAFFGCFNLTTISIPNNVSIIDVNAFTLCSNLESIYIPESVTRIEDNLFYGCSKLKSIVLPSKLSYIGGFAFYGCESIISIDLPDSVNTLRGGAFQKCVNLTKIKISNNVRELDSSTFYECVSLESVLLPSNLTYIGQYCFYKCTSLKSIDIPNTVTKIDFNAFQNCESLEEIEIPDNVNSIGSHALADCRSLTKVSLGDNLNKIDSEAFGNCISLESIEIPNSVTELGGYVFHGCTSLSSVKLGNNLTFIPRNAFAGCTSLVSINIPDNIKLIYNEAFCVCTNLSSITFSNVLGIYDFAFCGCTSLKTINFSDKLTGIDRYAFASCSSLTSVNIPNSVQYIGDYAFDDCENLKSVKIPKSVLTIENRAFGYYKGNLIDDFIIYGVKGTAAEEYAINNKIKFIAVNDDFMPPQNDVEQNKYIKNNPLEYKSFYFNGWYGDGGDQLINIPFSWDYFSSAQDPTKAPKYNNNLATLGLTLSVSAERGMQECNNNLESLEMDKFSNWYEYGFLTGVYKPGFSFGYKKVNIDGEDTNVFFVVLRGTSKMADILTDLEGARGGFSLAALNVLGRLKVFMEERTNKSYNELKNDFKHNKLFITGHSLGGAVADCLSSVLSVDFGTNNVYAYPFATPKTALWGENVGFTNIHNILNKNDTVTNLGTAVALGTRFGLEERFSSENDGIINYFQKLTGLHLTTRKKYLNDNFNLIEMAKLEHSPEVYLSYLLLKNSERSGFEVVTNKQVSIRCPVDVNVYNSKSELVGQVIDNKVQKLDNQQVVIQVDEDEKYIFMPLDDEYSFEIIPYDNGTMDISVEGFNNKDIEKQFTNVPISKDSKFGMDVNEELEKTKLIEEANGEKIEYLTGDADGSGDVNITDVTTIQKHLAKLDNEKFVENLADANHDSIISINDATLIQLYLVNLVPYL